MSADNFTGVWFDGNYWRVQLNMSMSCSPASYEECVEAYKGAHICCSKAEALLYAHEHDDYTEYGVRVQDFGRDTSMTALLAERDELRTVVIMLLETHGSPCNEKDDECFIVKRAKAALGAK